MIIHGSINSNKTDILIEEYLKLINSGVSAEEILVLTLNGRKKKYFTDAVKERLKAGNIGNINIYSFFALARNTILKYWPLVENMIKDKNAVVFPNLCGLEISQSIFKNCINEVEFKGYNSKVNLLHQLFRRYSLIVQNSLNADDITKREKILKEAFAPEANQAINLYKLKTLNHRAFDYLRQINIFEYLYKNTKNPYTYVFVDDGDEITPAAFEYLKFIKPYIKEFFIAADPFGSSRLGYLSATHIDFEKFLNEKANEANDNNKEALKIFLRIKNNGKDMPQNIENKGFIRRDEMIESCINQINYLIKNGCTPSDIAVITPESDSFLKYEFKKIKQEVFFLSGSEKLNQNPTVGSVIEILKITNTKNYVVSPFVLKNILLHLLKIDEDCAIKISQEYKEANREFKTGVLEFLCAADNKKTKDFLTFINLIKDFELAGQLLGICKKYIKQDLTNQKAILNLNKLLKQVTDFEEVFKNGVPKLKLIEQLENTIISENPLSEEEIPNDAIIISTAQKFIDSGLCAKHIFLLDASNGNWIKQDIGMLYNSWVFQKNWSKKTFEPKDNLELTQDRTARILYKLHICAKDKMYIYSSIYDSLGVENFGGIDKYFLCQTPKHSTPHKITPRDDQKDVLNYNGGKMAVSAVAGSGKTTIMLALIIKLLEEKGLEGENIFVLTYMESAARNFRERIKQNFPDMVELPQISTIHGLALRILKENNNYSFIGLDGDFEIIDENRRYEILSRIVAQLGLEQDKTDMYSRAISEFKNEGQELSKVKSPSFKNVYKMYDEELKAGNYTDYDDLLRFALKLLKTNKEVRNYYQELAHIVIEDEAQDSSAAQQELITVLGAKHGSIIRCGDVNQAITSTFSNSDVEGFKKFISQNNNVKMNYSQRCNVKIMDFANKVIDFANTPAPNAFLDIKMLPVKDKNPTNADALNINIFEKENSEKKFVVEEIKKIKAMAPNASVAILLRSNAAIGQWADFIEMNSIKTKKNIDCLTNNKAFRIILAVLNFINSPFDKKILKNTLETMLEISRYKNEREILNYVAKNNFSDIEASKYQLWWDLNYFLLKEGVNPLELVLEIGDFYFENTIEKANTAIVYSIVQSTLNSQKNFEGTVSKLNDIANKVNKSAKFYKEEDGENINEAINIMTLHKSKGDEFDFVFIPELTSSNLGLSKDEIKIKKNSLFIQNVKKHPKDENTLKQDIVDENFRLLYVGITRAKKKLYLTSAKSYKFYKKEEAKNPCAIFNLGAWKN